METQNNLQSTQNYSLYKVSNFKNIVKNSTINNSTCFMTQKLQQTQLNNNSHNINNNNINTYVVKNAGNINFILY
jgi:hypothetical protein